MTRFAKEVLVGVDVGTGSAKAAAYDLSGQVIAEFTSGYGLSRPLAGWVEQDAGDYWRAVCASLRGVSTLVRAAGSRIVAVGTCGQTPTLVLVDRAGDPVRPAITWQDTRATLEAAELRSRVSDEDLHRMLGMALPMEATYPPARLLWLSRREPEVVKRTAHVLQPKDFVNLRLTGEAASDAWDSKGIVHATTGGTDQEFFDLVEVPAEIAPKCLGPGEVLGVVSHAAAESTGVPTGVPVTTGWSDALCSVLGSGSIAHPSTAFDISGTSEIVGVHVASETVDAQPLLRAPFLPAGTSLVYGPTQTSGDALIWFGDTVLGLGGKPGIPDEVEMLAHRARPGSSVVFAPYLAGERAPLWNSSARAAFLGVSRNDGVAEMARSVLEGIAFSVRHVLEYAESAAGARAVQLRISGGGARSELAMQMRADALGIPVVVPRRLETATLGAAILAGAATGHFPAVEDAVCSMVHVGKTVAPSAAPGDGIEERYATYRRYAAQYSHN